MLKQYSISLITGCFLLISIIAVCVCEREHARGPRNANIIWEETIQVWGIITRILKCFEKEGDFIVSHALQRIYF